MPEWEEGAFGTSPRDPLPVPALILQTGVLEVPTMIWPSVKGARVQPEWSATLASWQAHGPPLTGNETSINIPLPTDGSARYFRLRSIPLLDADGDTLEEALLGTREALANSGSGTVAQVLGYTHRLSGALARAEDRQVVFSEVSAGHLARWPGVICRCRR